MLCVINASLRIDAILLGDPPGSLAASGIEERDCDVDAKHTASVAPFGRLGALRPADQRWVQAAATFWLRSPRAEIARTPTAALADRPEPPTRAQGVRRAAARCDRRKGRRHARHAHAFGHHRRNRGARLSQRRGRVDRDCRASASSCSARRRSNREPSPSFSRIRRSPMIRSISRIFARVAPRASPAPPEGARRASARQRASATVAIPLRLRGQCAAAPARVKRDRLPKIGSDCSTWKNSVNPAPSRRVRRRQDSERPCAPPARGA